MLILDASAAIEILIESEIGARWRDRTLQRDQTLCAPYLIDIEVMNALRRIAAMRPALAQRTQQAWENLSELRLERFGHVVLLPRIWALRRNVSAYDATYIALAEMLGAPLLTGDMRLSRTTGHQAEIIQLS